MKNPELNPDQPSKMTPAERRLFLAAAAVAVTGGLAVTCNEVQKAMKGGKGGPPAKPTFPVDPKIEKQTREVHEKTLDIARKSGNVSQEVTSLTVLKRYDEALRAIDKGGRDAKENLSLEYQRGNIYQLKGDLPKAIEVFKKAGRMEPFKLQPGAPWDVLAELEKKAGNLKRAKQWADIDDAIRNNTPNETSELGKKLLKEIDELLRK